ncbi:MAG: hypothetical protein HN712_13290 [Gemmatimonadetes bacterium]|nr:hypothetical protein [Gemmatimonadota bacterium]
MTTPLDIGSRLELLVDDCLVERMSDTVNLRLHHPDRREVVITFDRPWEGNTCGYGTVIRDADLYHLYYRGASMHIGGGNLTYTHPETTCYAQSRDGVSWEKPNLGLVEFDGSRENNIILANEGIGEGAGKGISHNFSPVLDTNPDCSPDARFKALGGCGGGLYALKSADGIRWTLLNDAPVVTEGAFDSQNLAFWDAERGCYVEYHRGMRDGRDVAMSTSDDFIHWSQPQWLEYEPERLTQLYTNQIEPYYRAPHLYVGFPARYVADRGWYSPINEEISESSGSRRCGTDYTDTGFITSRDGDLFNVWPEAFLRPGPTPELWMYGVGYTAWGLVETAPSVPGGPPEISFYVSDAGGWKGPANSLCRHTLRLDGFVSATAPLAGGELVTRPIIFDGSALWLNFETSVAGSIQVELQHADGSPIPGFALSDCPSMFGNSVHRKVEWTGEARLSSLAGKPARMRILIADADLFAFRFGEE